MGEGDDVVASGFPRWKGSGTPDQVSLRDSFASRGDDKKDGPPTNTVTPAPEPGSRSRLGRVQINPHQYFANVPEAAWSFHIGGYQPAQKWLKDRPGRSLSFDDITHDQRIVKILAETDRIMREIELPLDS